MYTTQFSVYGDFMQSSTMTIRLDDTLKSQLEKLAESTHRTKSYLAAEAGDLIDHSFVHSFFNS